RRARRAPERSRGSRARPRRAAADRRPRAPRSRDPPAGGGRYRSSRSSRSSPPFIPFMYRSCFVHSTGVYDQPSGHFPAGREGGGSMKKFVSRIAAIALLVGAASFVLAADTGSWSGWITDTDCGAKGASASHASCAAKCVKDKGAKYALYNPADK